MLSGRFTSILAVTVSSVVMSGCGAATGATTDGGSGGSDVAGPTISGPAAPPISIPNWDNPSGLPQADSISQAEAAMPMPIIVPADLGAPLAVFASPADTPDADRAVEFVYDSAQYGRVAVDESQPQLSPDEWAQFEKNWVDSMAQAGTDSSVGQADLATVSNGSQALITTGPWGEAQWLESPTLEVQILGPKLQESDLVAIADNLGETTK